MVADVLVPVGFPVLALIGLLADVLVVRPAPMRALEIAIRWWFAVAVGLDALWVALLMVIAPRIMAHSIGFPADNPFQFEIAMANLALGLMGLACRWTRDRSWEVTALGAAAFLWARRSATSASTSCTTTRRRATWGRS